MIENFKGKENSNGFAKNPQNGNKNGRPKKWISLINAKLKEKGFEPAKKSEIEEVYLQLVNLPEENLKKLLLDKKQPMLVRIVIKNILDSKRGFDIVEKILDRAIGKPMQKMETEMKNEISISSNALESLNSLLCNTVSEQTTSEK